MTMHTRGLESAPPTEIIQLIDGEYVKRAPTKEELARMPVLQMVTGFTCDHCGSTDVEETGLHKSSYGQWIVTKCGNCDVTVMYKTE